MKTTTQEQKHGAGFPWRLVLLVLAAGVAGHFAGTDSHALAGHWGAPWWLRGLVAVALLGFCSRWLHGHRGQPGTGGAAAGFLLGLQWLALDIHHGVHGLPGGGHGVGKALEHPLISVTGALAGALLFWGLWECIQKTRHGMEPLRQVKRTKAETYVKTHPLSALVLFVSPPNRVPEHTGEGLRFPGKDGTFDRILPGKSAREDIEKMEELGYTPGHTWQQLLRAVAPHYGLGRVILLGSPGVAEARGYGEVTTFNEGSSAYLELCAAFLKPYLNPLCVFETHGGVHFEQPSALREKIRALREGTLKELKSIAIDITGGQKTNSIIAALETLHDDTVVQYVQTAATPAIGEGKAKPEAYIYNFELEEPMEVPG